MSRRRRLLAVVFLLVVAAALRFHQLSAQSYWNDEGNSARLSERAIPAILEGTASDIHPPLYYLILRGWRELVGETEFGLRSFSAFAGLLTVAAVVALARQGGLEGGGKPADRRSFAKWLIPITAGLLAAMSPVLVYYSQETRMYALLALVAVLSTWALFVWLGRGGRGWAAAYILLITAGFYTHYFFPAVLAAQGVVVITMSFITPFKSDRIDDGNGSLRGFIQLGERWGFLLRWLFLVAIAALLYLPWVPIFIRQVGGREEIRTGVGYFVESFRWMILGSTVYPAQAIWALVAALALVFLGIFTNIRRAVVFLPFIVVPLVFMFLVGATDPAFYKFLLTVVPFGLILMASAWHTSRRWLWLPALLTVLVLAGSVVALKNLYADPNFARADYRAMASRIAADRRNVGVILVAPNQWEVFTYYHQDGAPVYPLPIGRPDAELLEPELETITAAHDRLYVLFWGDSQRDPEHVVERWLDAHTFKVSEEWVGDVRFAVYAVPSHAPDVSLPGNADFQGLGGETISLVEYTLWPLTARPGDIVQAQLKWTADQTPARPYKVFIHLLAPDGRLVAQNDGEPSGGSRPTTGWMAGEIIVDNHGLLLPPDLPPGEYSLRLGLYDAFDPAGRLPVIGEDSVLLATIDVAP